MRQSSGLLTALQLVLRLVLAVGLGVIGWVLIAQVMHRQSPDLEQASVELHKGDTLRARFYLDNYVHTAPTAAATYEEVSGLLSTYGQWSMAEEYLQRGIQACRHVSNTDLAVLHSSLADAYAKTDTAKPQFRAISEASMAQKIDPSSPFVLNTLGYLMVQNDQNLPLARQYLADALRAARKNSDTANEPALLAEIEDSYGWALYKLKDYNGAVDVLTQAADRMSALGSKAEAADVIYYHLGMAYMMAGRAEDARNALNVSLEYNPTSADALSGLSSLKALTAHKPAINQVPAGQKPGDGKAPAAGPAVKAPSLGTKRSIQPGDAPANPATPGA
ncbi:MAG: hypothetical protein KGJ62_09135 [Armatimonadetes bacterium]|nr:hypothetical protein [Armatimonadota bacterium]MDE2207608.1 hypothetical protein [Armatimonadota bacterium]